MDVELGDKIDFLEEVPSPELKKKYMINSLMEEAIASSQLEGAVTSREAAKRMLRENRKPKNKSEQMIYNNYFTMKYIKETAHSGNPLSLELIREIHRRIAKDTLEDKSQEGAFRTDDEIAVYAAATGELLHTPPHHTEIEGLMQKVCDFANGESREYYLHPIVKALVLHYLIGYLHPFYDGNGRTARAIFYWFALSQRYDYIEYVAVSTAIKNAPSQYAMAYLYSESDHNDVTYFVKFGLDKLGIAIDSFEKYVERTRTENRKIIETIRYDQNLNFRQADAVLDMCRKGVKQTTIEEMSGRYHITYQTARTDLLGLERLGYLSRITVGKRFVFLLDRDKCLHLGQGGGRQHTGS